VPFELRLTIGQEALRLPTTTPAERADALERVNQAAWPLDAGGRTRLISDVMAWCGGTIAPRATHRVLTATEVHTLAGRPGHDIGSHTVHHLALTTQPSATVEKEISDDRTALQELLQQPVHLFSYPYGDFNAATVAAVANAGFRAAVTVQRGLVKAGINRLLLPRYEVTAADFGRFPLRLQEMFADCSAAPSGIG
jgi:peptidoglycan/xylan/chitin deacetylase (PgdA/CDA1 family)